MYFVRSYQLNILADCQVIEIYAVTNWYYQFNTVAYSVKLDTSFINITEICNSV